jgi:nucleotidyltransferase AbiEii toxin of type IV toxin-antitoxin system
VTGPAKGYRKVFADVCAEKVEDDGVIFLADTIPIEKIRDEEAYEDIRVLLEARLANARIPLQIDVGFGDVITPAPIEIGYPTLLEFPAAKMHAYSRESVVAEKFAALIKLGLANSRMKDFYDLWVMSKRFEFRSPVLAEALAATFDGRQSFRRRVRSPLHRSFPRAGHNKRNGKRFCGRADWKRMRRYKRW